MDWRIDNIEALTEDEAYKMCGNGLHMMTIKGHNCYFIDFGGYFGYSVIVFAEGRQIKYANDYELHHKYTVEHEGLNGLLKWYIGSLNNKLFTEDELSVVNDYDEFERKRQYISNFYPLRREYISWFFIGSDEERERLRAKVETMIDNPYSHCWFKPEDKDFSDKICKMMDALYEAKDKQKDSYEYWLKAFKSEMYNHEYGINWQADYDVLSCFGGIHYTERDDEVACYFEQLGFNDTQRTAYIEARKEYYNETRDW